jgi:Family of unknown function (DUF6232)
MRPPAMLFVHRLAKEAADYKDKTKQSTKSK